MSGVEIRVRSDSRQARQDLRRLERSVSSIEKTATGVSTAFKRLAVGIASAFTGTALTKSINGATDSLTSLENRIALVTGRGKELNTQLDALYRIAKETKSPVDATVETFNRFAISLKAAGKSTKEINEAVRSVGLATTISGGSAESTRAALFQLGQGLASGQLRGQELNSVLEQAPRLARVISDSLQVPFGSLRKLAEQGRITTDVVFEALIDQTQKLESEFGNIQITSEKAFSILRDQVGRVTGEISKQLGITAAFTTRIVALTDYIEANREAIVASVVDAGRILIETFSGVTAVIGGLARIITVLFGRAVDSIPNLTSPFRDFSQVLKSEVISVMLYTSALIKRLGLDFGALYDKVFNTRFQGAIRDIFRSKSLTDFGNALYSLGDALDTYGRRWYNFGNAATRALKTTNVFLFETGVYLGLIDQTLFRLRYTSFERFTKAFGVFSSILGEIQRNIAASNFFVAIQVSVIKSIQLLDSFIDALDNLSGNRLSRISTSMTNLFTGIYKTAQTYLNKTLSLVSKFTDSASFYFYKAYDAIIGNSWWTDTMEGTYLKAQEWLPKTKNLLKQFGGEVTDLYQDIAKIFSATNISRESKIKLTIEKVGFESKAKVNTAKELAETVAKSIGEGARGAFSALRDLSPQLAALLATGVAASLTSIISPSLFKNTFGKLGPFFAAALAVSVISAFNGAFLKSGVLEEISKGLGLAIGQGINTIITNVPAILKTLLRVAKAFGEGLADAIGNSIIGLPAQILSLLPGGGLLTTILYGGLGAAIFFKGVRTLLLSNIRGLLTTIGTRQGSGMLYNLFVGSNPDNLKKNIVAKTKDQANAAAMTAAAANKRAGRLQLAQIGGYVLGAELLLGDLIGTSGAAIVGITASIAQQAILGDPKKVAFIVSTFNGLLASVVGKVTSLNLFSAATGIAGTFLSGLTSKFSAALTGITVKNVAATSMFATSWGKASSFASVAVGKFSTSSIRKIGKIGLMVAGITAAFATMASASEDGGESTGAGFGAIGFALLAFGDTILSYLLPAIGKLGKGIANVGRSAALNIGRAALGAVTKLAVGVAGVAAGVPLITGAFLVAAGTLATLATGGLIYSAFFGEGGSFLDRVRSNFDGVLAYFNLLNVSLGKTRKESVDTLKNIEKLIGKEFNIKLSAQLDSVDLSQASDTQLLAIEKAVKLLDKNRRLADREEQTFGRITEETRESIRKAVAAVEGAIRDGSGTASPTSMIAKQLRDTFHQILEKSDKTVIQRIFADDTGSVAQAKILKDTLDDPKFTGQNSFEDPAVARAFASQVLLGLPNVTRENIPPEIKSLLVAISTRGILDSNVTDAFLGQNAFNARTLLEVISGSNRVNVPQVQLDNLGNAIDSSNNKFKAETFFKLKTDTASQIEAALGRGLTQGEEAGLNVRNISEFGRIIKKIQTQEKLLGFDSDDQRQIDAILRASQKVDGNQDEIKELLFLKQELSDLAKVRLKFGIEEGTISVLNEELSRLGTTLLDRSLGKLTNSVSNAGTGSVFAAIETTIANINTLQKERGDLVAQSVRDEKDLTAGINDKDAAIAKSIATLDIYIQKLNVRQASEDDWLGTVQSAAELATSRDINLNDLLKLDQSTLMKLVEAQTKISLLQVQLQQLGTLGFINGTVDGMARGEIESALTAQIKIIQDALKNVGKSTGGSGETIFEKFVGRLSDSGFAFDLNSASSLARSAIIKLQSPLKAIEAAQKRIVKASLTDTKARSAALKVIKESREEIFKTLNQGTVGQAQIGFEAMGLDPNLVSASNEAKGLAFEILSIQDKINNTSMSDVDTRKDLNNQLLMTQNLLEGITGTAENSAKAMQDSLASGLKGLLKGEVTVKSFFNDLLDTLSNQIIDTVVDSFVQAFFIQSNLKSTFEDMFSGLFSSGDSLGEKFGKSVGDSVTDSLGKATADGGGWLDNLFGAIGGLFGGGSSGGNIFGSIAGFLGGFNPFAGISLSQGGTVPSTSYSQAGKDSVPAMLTPGELVVPTNRVKDFSKGDSKSQTVVNLSITGDISRQTRTEIVKMLPTIANGVNAQNKERNYKYR